MDFHGNAARVTELKINQIAGQLDTDAAHVMAVVSVEARGRGFAGKSGTLLQALFERHKFYSELAKKDKAKLAKAVALGLASKKPGGYPKSLEGVHEQIAKAMAIDEDAALCATSWGMGQVMGFNCKAAGYESARAMVEAFLTGEDAQIQAMADFIVHKSLDDELRRGDWAGFARGYNGKNYEINDYDGKLAAAHKRFSMRKPVSHEPKAAEADVVRMGQKGELVGELQRLLTQKGFPVTVDKDFGGKTKRAVRLFQLDQGLDGTGRVDPKTWQALQQARDEVQPEARAEATAKDLKDQSRIVKDGLTTRNIGIGVGTAVGTVKTLQETGVLEGADQLTEGMGKLNAVIEAAKPLIQFAAENWWVLVVAGSIAVAVYASRVVRARVQDHREGRTA